jgi:hypothetical protein
MKKFFSFLVLLAGMLVVIGTGCKKDPEPDPVVPPVELILTGSVVNAATNVGIAGATVEIAGQTTLTTDAAGVYKLNVKKFAAGAYLVRASAAGYGYGSVVATVDANTAMANAITLAPLAPAVTIPPQGGNIKVPDHESVDPGAEFVLTVPSGAFSQDVKISLTRFTGIAVPGYAVANKLNMVTFNMAIEGPTSSKPIQMVVPLPVRNLTSGTLDVLKYDPATDTWQTTGLTATINSATGKASFEISASGAYSLALSGKYVESQGIPEKMTFIEVDPALSLVNLSYQATKTFPEGVPDNISLAYLTSIAEQNTYQRGTRVSFSALTHTTVNYIGTKPDSIPTKKSTNAGFYRWVPKIGLQWVVIPSVTTIDGLRSSVNGLVRKEMQSDQGAYVFVHDQGGGK